MIAPADLFHLWVYLAASPLLWLTVTIGVYLMAQQAAALSRYNPLVNPVLISIVVIVLLLIVTKTDYRVYFAGAQFVHFTLGPATVALGVPLYRNRALVRSAALPIIAALAVGAPTAMLSAVWIASALGAPMALKLAMIPKSVTAGIVISTGIIGAIMVTPLMNLLGIRDYAARGFAAGLSAHGIGTARAFQVDDVAGAFAGLAMALNGLMTAIGAPLILALIGR
jgi:putative effector of murein hydrolase